MPTLDRRTHSLVLRIDSIIEDAIWQKYSAPCTAHNLALHRNESLPSAPAARRKLLAPVEFLVIDTVAADRAMIDMLPHCAAIVRTGDGYDSIDIDYATSQGIICCNQPAVWSYETAEYAFVLGLMQLRRIPQLARADRSIPRAKLYRKLLDIHAPIHTARGITVGVVGFGNIGREVCKLYGRMVARICVTDSHVTPSTLAHFAKKERLSADIQSATLEETLALSDIITLHVPGNAANHFLFSTAQFAQMKRSAIVINCARGRLIDTDALSDALARGEISYAILDTISPEVLPQDHYLSTSDRVSVLPHFAWYSHEALHRMCRSICETLTTLAKGELPPCVLNGDKIAPECNRVLLRAQELTD